MFVFCPKQEVRCENRMLPELPQGRDDGKPAAKRWAAEEVEAVQSARCSCPRWPLVVGEWLAVGCLGVCCVVRM